MDKLEQYLEQVCRSIGGPRALRQHVRQELREHLRDAAAQHRAAGLSEAEALDRALADFGGPDEVRTELEATHGHRMLPVVIDKAMQWKEMTMRAKWLWTTWAYLAVVCVIVLEVLFLTFSSLYLVPKLKRITADGWLEDAMSQPPIEWGYSFLNRVDWVLDKGLWLVLGLATIWGLFEWRVRSENKPFMRLSALSTGAVGLMVVVFLVAAALVLPFMLGLPAMMQLTRPFVVEQTTTIDTSVAAMEQAMANKDWQKTQEQADQASRALSRLTAGLPAMAHRTEPPTLDELKAQLSSAKESFALVEQATRKQDALQMEAALKKFRASFEPLREAAKRAGK